MPFNIQTQQQTLWCWAAVAASIDAYFAPSAAKDQSTVADGVLHRGDCSPTNRHCNQTSPLQDALKVVGKLREPPLTKPLEFDALRQQIDQKLPVCVRIEWPDGGGHFVVISGYSITPLGKQMVIVKDPWYVDSVLAFEELSSDYLLAGGTWSDSFLVKPS